MTEQAAAPVEAAKVTIPEGIEQIDSVDDRANMLFEVLEKESMQQEPAAPAKAEPAAAPAPAPAPEPAPAPVVEPTESRAEKFARMRAQERAKFERSTREKADAQRVAELERIAASLEQERKQIEPLLRIAKTKDAMALHEWVTDNFQPDEIGAAYSKWTSDDAREKWRTRSVKDEALSEANAKIEELKKYIEETIVQPQKQAQQRSEQQSVQENFMRFVADNEQFAPLTAKLGKKNPEWLIAQADTAANILSRRGPFSWSDVIDYLERNHIAPEQPAAPTGTGQSTQGNAQAKATTVTNRHAAERTTVNESDEPLEEESLDERAAKLSRAFQGQSLTTHRR